MYKVISLYEREVEAGGRSEATSVQVTYEQAPFHLEVGRSDLRSVRSLPRAQAVAWGLPRMRLLSRTSRPRDEAGRRVSIFHART